MPIPFDLRYFEGLSVVYDVNNRITSASYYADEAKTSLLNTFSITYDVNGDPIYLGETLVKQQFQLSTGTFEIFDLSVDKLPIVDITYDGENITQVIVYYDVAKTVVLDTLNVTYPLGEPVLNGTTYTGMRLNPSTLRMEFSGSIITDITTPVIDPTVTETSPSIFDIPWTFSLDVPILQVEAVGGLFPYFWTITSDPDDKFKIDSFNNELFLSDGLNIFQDIQHLVTIMVTDSVGKNFEETFTFNLVAGTFDNSHSVDFPNGGNLISFAATPNGTTTFSISYWCDPNKFDKAFFTRWDGLTECCWRVYGDGKKPRFEISGDGSATNLQSRRTQNDQTEKVWNHFIFTFNAGTINVYANGVLNNGNTSGVAQAAVFNSISQTLEIGDSPNNPKGTLDGLMDEFSTYNIELSALEVTEIYNGGTPTDLSQFSNSAGLIEWYRFGDNEVDNSIPEVVVGTNKLTFENGLTVDDISTDVPP